jgi:hypothetical protein
MIKAAPYPKPLPRGKGTYRRNTRIAFGSNGHRKERNKRATPMDGSFGIII